MPQRVSPVPRESLLCPEGSLVCPEGLSCALRSLCSAPRGLSCAPRGLCSAPRGLSCAPRVSPLHRSRDEPSAGGCGSSSGLGRRRGSAPGRGAAGPHLSHASFLSAGWLRCSDHLLLAGAGKQQLKIEGDFWFTQMTRDNFGSPKAKETKLSGFNGSLSPSCSMFMGKQAADQTRQTAAGEAQ